MKTNHILKIYFFCAITCFLINSNNILFSQDEKYPFKKYSDRWEGIVEDRQLVAGEKLVLISAKLETNENIPITAEDAYNLKFCLEKSDHLKIEVWGYEKYDKPYKMVPLRTKYLHGLNTFSWPSKISKFYNFSLNDLSALAQIITTDNIPVYVPLVLYCKDKNIEIENYNFCFIPFNSIEILEYKICEKSSGITLYYGKLSNLIKENKFSIKWNGRNTRNELVQNGYYILIIQAAYKARPGKKQKPEVTTIYEFYHNIEILTN